MNHIAHVHACTCKNVLATCMESIFITGVFYLFCQLTSAHKRHGTPPHRMFAMDTIVRIAINLALQNVSPGR